MRQLRHTFSKASRLLTANDFQAVFDDVQFKVSSQAALLLARRTDRKKPRIGFVIAKKTVRLATARNKIKRVARESFRLQPIIANVDIVILARRGLDRMSNQALHQLWQQMWHRLQKKFN